MLEGSNPLRAFEYLVNTNLLPSVLHGVVPVEYTLNGSEALMYNRRLFELIAEIEKKVTYAPLMSAEDLRVLMIAAALIPLSHIHYTEKKREHHLAGELVAQLRVSTW